MKKESKPGGSSLRNWLEARFNLTEMFSVLTSFGLFPAELDTRRPLGEAIDEALSRPFPSYVRWPRVLGILCLLLFASLGLTGVMLAFYYQPTVSEAYTSVTTVVRDVNFGWFVHQVHGWAARLLLLMLLVRIWRFYFQGLYKRPREAFWMVAVATFLAAAAADFTGRLLPWDAGGYWTTVRGMEVIHSLPLVGPLFAFLVSGRGPDSLVLIRFYFLHVVILPGLLLFLFYLNFSGVRRLGLSDSPGENRPVRRAFKTHLYDLLIVAALVFGALVTLATVLPAPFDRAADPFTTPAGLGPPWYLLAPHALLESMPSLLPRWFRGLLVEAILVMGLLLPFLDRSPARRGRERRLALALGVMALVLWALLTASGHRMEVVR